MILDFLSLQLNWFQMFLRHNVAVVKGLHARLNRELVSDILLGHILNAKLIVSAVKCCEVMLQKSHVSKRLQFLSSWVSNCQDEIFRFGLDSDDG